MNLFSHQIGDDFLMGRSQASVMVVTIFEPQEFSPIELPSPTFLPQFSGLDGRHQQFDGTGTVHLFSYNLLVLPTQCALTVFVPLLSLWLGWLQQTAMDQMDADGSGEVEFEVSFEINGDGIVSVVARDSATGEQASTTITLSSGLSEEDMKRILEQNPAARVATAEAPKQAAAPVAPNDEIVLLDEAAERGGAAPKALIVPHAGYIYSGPVAASAYAQLRPFGNLGWHTAKHLWHPGCPGERVFSQGARTRHGVAQANEQLEIASDECRVYVFLHTAKNTFRLLRVLSSVQPLR